MLPLARVLGTGGMIRVELFYSRFPKRIQCAVDFLAAMLWTMLFGLLARQGWVYALASLNMGEYTSGSIAFAVAPAKMLLAAAFTLAAFQSLYDLCATGRRLIQGTAWTR